MAAEAVPPNSITNLPEFVREIFYPSSLSSFRESMPTGELEIHLHRSPEEITKIRLINMFPFMTLNDIKLALYLELKREDIAVPQYIYFCTHGKGLLASNTFPLDFSWNLPSVNPNAPFFIKDPFKMAAGETPLDNRFVDSGGERRLVSPVDRERITIEDFFKKQIREGIPVIHAYLYADLLKTIAASPAGNPPSEREWNGRLYPMFPHLKVSSPNTGAEYKADADRKAMVFLRRQQFLVRLESILERDVPLVTLQMGGIKYLQLTWEKKKKFQGIENFFYEVAVNERLPFFRLITTENSGMSKVFLKDGKIPDISDPKLIVQWAQDRSPTPEQDFAFAKIMLRKGQANVPPIYATLRLFNDGTADCVVEPPKTLKKLHPQNDLMNFGENLVEGLQGFSYLDTMPELGKGIVVLGLRLQKRDEEIITQRILRDRLPIFSSMFQEISPLPGERPMVMLRYKLISNFVREDRIQEFLTQVINRKVLRGEGGVSDLVNLVADEFQIDEDLARKYVAIKLRNQGEISLVVPETKEYMRQNNPGIDVAIFATHPFYTFHLYNVNSLENLQRITTALSILMSADPSDLQVSAKAVKELVTAEGVAEQVAEAAKTADSVAAELPVQTENAEDAGGADDLPDYLDFFAFEKGDDEMTLEELHEQEVAEAARIQPTARPDPPNDINAPVPQTTHELRKELRASQGNDNMAGIPVTRRQAAPTENDSESVSLETGGIAHYFLSRLREADSRLFGFSKSNPASKRYVSQCQPTHGRQPAVLSEEKFIEMRDEYAKDNVTFQIYPIQPGEPEKPVGIAEKDYYTVLKYGSTPQSQNYYLCCRYFCVRDEILVREIDFYGTQMRRPTRRSDGTVDAAKRPGECPFCRGRLIDNKRAPGPNETVLERIVKPSTQDKRHLFINFMRKSTHPEGFYLPCCFTKNVPIKMNNPAFDKYKEWGISPSKQLTQGEKEEEDEDDFTYGNVLHYATILNLLPRKYIVGAEKLPLDISPFAEGKMGEAQIGLLPSVIDGYFDQEPTQLVSRAFNPQKIKPDGMGFLRIAVENRQRYQNDSLLAAIAPFYNKNNAREMKQHIIDSVQPREFLALNYGNLALEFYDPGDSNIAATDSEIQFWASKYLNLDKNQENWAAIKRAYVSFNTFQEWLLSDTTKKEYRHFALLLSQSNILRKSFNHGITFIILDIMKDGTLTVRCSPYGFIESLMNKNDVAFLLHHWSGIWEPIFYADNRPNDKRKELYALFFQYSRRESWPPIVHQRLSEFVTQCTYSGMSVGRSIYTSYPVHSLAMIPASFARQVLEREEGIAFDSILRDSYNHVAALVFRETKDNLMIALPVVDDGDLMVGKNLILDWDDPVYRKAPVDRIIRFYEKYVKTRFKQYEGIYPKSIVKVESRDTIEGIKLNNGIIIPGGPPSSEEAARQLDSYKVETIQEMEWTKNREIYFENNTDLPGEKDRMSTAEFQEIFEHLRLTFANWLAIKEDGANFRNELRGVIFSQKLPLYEKRKRLEIMLKRDVDKWTTTEKDEDEETDKEVSLLRVNCYVRDKDSCSGRCLWKQDADKCLLHVPETTKLGEKEEPVQARRVLLLRLIEELIRFADKRSQLFNNNVSRLVSIDKPVEIAVPDSVSKQIIYPEKSAAWYELLRLEWAKLPNDKPKFLEEMSRDYQAEPLAKQTEETVLPERLLTILNGGDIMDPRTGAIRLFRAPFETLLSSINAPPVMIGITDSTSALDDTMMRKIVMNTGDKVMQIDLRINPPMIIGKKPFGPIQMNDNVPVFIITEDGPALIVLDLERVRSLKIGEMPKGLQNTIESIMKREKSVMIVMGKKPPPAAPLPSVELPRPTD